jgi:hypothetical protein
MDHVLEDADLDLEQPVQPFRIAFLLRAAQRLG